METARASFSPVNVTFAKQQVMIEGILNHTFPHRNGNGVSVSYATQKASYQSIVGEHVNEDHRMEGLADFEGENKIVGHVAAVEFDESKEADTTDIVPTKIGIRLFNIASVKKRLSKEAAQLGISAEWSYSLDHSVLYVGDYPKGKYVEWADAADELKGCVDVSAGRVSKTYQGQQVTLLTGGRNGQVYYGGAAILKNPADTDTKGLKFMVASLNAGAPVFLEEGGDNVGGKKLALAKFQGSLSSLESVLEGVACLCCGNTWNDIQQIDLESLEATLLCTNFRKCGKKFIVSIDVSSQANNKGGETSMGKDYTDEQIAQITKDAVEKAMAAKNKEDNMVTKEEHELIVAAMVKEAVAKTEEAKKIEIATAVEAALKEKEDAYEAEKIAVAKMVDRVAAAEKAGYEIEKFPARKTRIAGFPVDKAGDIAYAAYLADELGKPVITTIPTSRAQANLIYPPYQSGGTIDADEMEEIM